MKISSEVKGLTIAGVGVTIGCLVTIYYSFPLGLFISMVSGGVGGHVYSKED